MGIKFIIQVKKENKWKAVHKGEDPDKAAASYRVSSDEVGCDNVRALKSDGTKDDGTTKWIVAEIPEEPEPEPEPEPETTSDIGDINKGGHWRRTLTYCVIAVIGLYQFTTWILDNADGDPTQDTKSAQSSPKQVTRLRRMESHLEAIVKAGGPTDILNAAGYLAAMKGQNMKILYGGKLQSQNLKTLKIGTILFKGRPLPAGLVESNATIVNAQLGEKGQICIRLAGAIDKEFDVYRFLTYLPCIDTKNKYSKWVAERKFTQ